MPAGSEGSGVPEVPDVPDGPEDAPKEYGGIAPIIESGTGGYSGIGQRTVRPIPDVPDVPDVPAATPAFTPEEQASLDAWDQEMEAYAPYSDVDVGALAQMLPYACEVLGAQHVVESAWECLHIEARLVAANVASDRVAYVDVMDDFVCTAGTELTHWALNHGLGKLRIPCAVHLGPAGSVFMMLVLNDGDKRPYILRRTSGPDASGVPAT